MAITKAIASSDKTTTRSFLNQLIDVLQQDISSSVSRRKYQVFVTGGIGPGVTSSLFQTVYDQDFTLQTANPIFDVTVGLAAPDAYTKAGVANNSGIAALASIGLDSGGKYLYPSSSLMMREKTDVYGQFAQALLGDRNLMFELPNDASSLTSTGTTPTDSAMFVAFKRLFARDQIKRETFAMRFYQTASTDAGHPNIFASTTSGSAIFTDIGSSQGRYFDTGGGGQYGYIVNAADTTKAVGLMYYDTGIAVLDIGKVTDTKQAITGTISAMAPLGQTVISASLSPNFLVSGSIDNVIDHFCYTRFGGGALTAVTFQNVTNINSSLIFCRALPDDFNYSSNPTYIEQNGSYQGRLTIYDPTLPEETQEPFSYITTIGLYDNSGGLVAVAKLSRPVEKNPSRDLTMRVRIDF